MLLPRPSSGGAARALRNARTLSGAEWAVLMRATGLLTAVAVGLKLLRFRKVLALVERLASAPAVRPPGQVAADRTAHLVETASRWVLPQPTCLTKALVVFTLLGRRRLPVELVVGIAKAGGLLEAHAWVRHAGETVAGGRVPRAYTPLVRIVAGGSSAGDLRKTQQAS